LNSRNEDCELLTFWLVPIIENLEAIESRPV